MAVFASSGERGGLWRSRWAAIGAAVAVTFGAGGLFAANAASPESSTVAIEPVRILDTRNDVGLAGPFVSATAQDLKVTGSIPTATGTQTVVPAGATGVYLNVTPVSSTAGGFISVRPANAAGLPTTSNVNFTTGAINPNAVLVELPVGGGDDGKIEITFDAFGAAGPTTEVLVDVVGYTTDTRLKAIETALATKANSADVYTKTEIDARPFDSLVGGGLVLENGTLNRSFGNVSVTRTALGSYRVTSVGITNPCNLTIQITVLNQFGNATNGFASAGFSGSTAAGCYVDVDTTNAAQAAADQIFNFTLFQGGTGVLPLTASDPATCVADPTQSC